MKQHVPHSDVKVAGELQTVSRGQNILTSLIYSRNRVAFFIKREMKQTGDNYAL